ncbi:MAG: hypothetical protein Q9174_002855 [Haloplaca sp. 1 TL-2023]
MPDLKTTVKTILGIQRVKRNAFSEKLDVFLQPKPELEHLSPFAQQQEGLYAEVSVPSRIRDSHPSMQTTAYRLQAYHALMPAEAHDRRFSDCYTSLEKVKFSSLIWPPSTPAQRLWMIDIMSRCALLLAYLHTSPGVRIELDCWAAEARREKETLDGVDYLVKKNLDDVVTLCTEMRGRILAEEPRERWCDEAQCRRRGHQWPLRVSPKWMKATEGWVERCKDLKTEDELRKDEAGLGSWEREREVWGLRSPEVVEDA